MKQFQKEERDEESGRESVLTIEEIINKFERAANS